MLRDVHPIPGKERRGHGGGCEACRPWGRRARFQAVCVAWSWFRQSGVVSSRPPAVRRLAKLPY